MEFRGDAFHRQLIATLDALSLDPDQQLEHISQLSMGVDELALEFDDVYHLASGKSRQGVLPATTLATIKPINDHLAAITASDADLWNQQALRNSPKWQELRKIARSTKSELGD